MSNTLVGAPFQSILAKVQNARVLSEEKRGNMPLLGETVVKTLDTNADGVVDARLTESKKGSVTRRELSFLDAQGRPVDSFVSGTRVDPFFGPSETGRVWSATHREYAGASKEPVREVYERADNTSGELLLRATTTTEAGTERCKVEMDRDGNGSLETTVWAR